MKDPERSLIPLIYEVIENQGKWYEVLEALCRTTGAAKGVLFLRDLMTAELVVPPQMENSFDSPLLYNFEETDVQSFVDEYFQYDPWTPIEKLYHPFRPYALSTYLPHEELVATKFWEWLEPQGIGDTVVVEIGRLPKQWVGLNLYFHHDDNETRQQILNVLTELLPYLQKAWQISEIVREGTLAENRLLRFLESNREAAVILHQDGAIVAANEKAKQLINGPINIVGRHIEFKSSDIRKKIKSEMHRLCVELNEQQSSKLNLAGYTLTLSLMGPVKDFLGIDNATCLLTLKPNSIENTCLNRLIWDNHKFTLTEKELVHHLAHGGKVKTFSDVKGISPAGADYHWRNVKKKLDIEHPREIFAIHKIFLSFNYDLS